MCKSGIPLKDVKSSEWNYSGIYKITNIVNGKCYIGQSINIKQRLIKHYNNFLNHQEAKIYKAINKYGIDSFEVQIVVIINTFGKSNSEIKNELNAQECFYINLYDSYKNGYNSTPGGDSGRLGFKHSQETIEKLKASHKNYIPKAAKDKMRIVYCYDLKNKVTICVPSINSAFLRTGADYRSISQICNNHNYRQGGRTISRKRYLFSFSQEELEDRVKHYFENDRFQQKNQKF